MLSVMWGIAGRPKCECTCKCTCKQRDQLQDSLGSLGVEWGLHVRPKDSPPAPAPAARSPSPQAQGGGEPDASGEGRPSASRDAATPSTGRGDSQWGEGGSEADQAKVFDEIDIDESVAQMLCFTERLDVVCTEGAAGHTAVLGQVSISVTPSRTPHHLHVRITGTADMSKAESDEAGDDQAEDAAEAEAEADAAEGEGDAKKPKGTQCSTSVNGCIDWENMRTADERRYERCENPEQELQEKHLYMAQDENNPSGHYFNIVARQRVGDFEDRRAQDVPYETVTNLASEAVLVVLLRYVGMTGMVCRLNLQAVLPNGALTPLVFESTKPKKRTVYGSEVLCVSVTQTTSDARGCKVVLRSLVSHSTGQLLRHAPEDAEGGCGPGARGNFVLRLPRGSSPAMNSLELGGPEPLVRTWRQDLQAKATLRDKKEELLIRFRGYLLDRPEVRWMLAGYVQAALLSRPTDGIALAQHHFAGPPLVPESPSWQESELSDMLTDTVQKAEAVGAAAAAVLESTLDYQGKKALEEALDKALDEPQASARSVLEDVVDDAVRTKEAPLLAVEDALRDAVEGAATHALGEVLDDVFGGSPVIAAQEALQDALEPPTVQPYGEQWRGDPAWGGQPYAQQPYGQQPYAQQPYQPPPYDPYAQQQQQQQPPYDPYAQQPYAQPYAQQPYQDPQYADPYAQQGYPQAPYDQQQPYAQPYPQQPYDQQPYAQDAYGQPQQYAQQPYQQAPNAYGQPAPPSTTVDPAAYPPTAPAEGAPAPGYPAAPPAEGAQQEPYPPAAPDAPAAPAAADAADAADATDAPQEAYPAEPPAQPEPPASPAPPPPAATEAEEGAEGEAPP